MRLFICKKLSVLRYTEQEYLELTRSGLSLDSSKGDKDVSNSKSTTPKLKVSHLTDISPLKWNNSLVLEEKLGIRIFFML